MSVTLLGNRVFADNQIKMRSFPVGWVSLYKEEIWTETSPEGRPGKDRGRAWRARATSPRHPEPSERERQEGPSRGLLGEHSPGDTLISTSGLQNSDRICSCCFKKPGCGTLLQKPRRSYITTFNFFIFLKRNLTGLTGRKLLPVNFKSEKYRLKR